MSALTLLENELLTRPFAGRGAWDHDAEDMDADLDFRAGGEKPTLNDVIVGAWEGLAANRPAPCPVCHGTLTPRYGAGPAPVAATCGDCGSELS
jgi:hypothetical protein